MAGKSLYPRFLIKLPWWFDILLAGGVYYALKYWFPTLYFQNAMVNRFVHALPQFAEIFALILLVNASFSAYHAWQNWRSRKQR